MSNRQSFTLIELLVVVAIIAVLVAVLLPAMTAAVAQSRTVACQSNLRELSTAVWCYAQEFDGWTPNYPRKTNYDANRWFDTMNGRFYPVNFVNVDHSRKRGILYCPAESNSVGAYDSVVYAYNMVCMFRKLEVQPYGNPRSRVVMFLDCYPSHTSLNMWHTNVAFRITEAETEPCYRHNEGLNILFQDLHVAYNKIRLTYPAHRLDFYAWE